MCALTGISLDLSCNLSFLLSPGFRQVETLLQIQPKLRACPEITSQTKRSLGSNGAAPMHDVVSLTDGERVAK